MPWCRACARHALVPAAAVVSVPADIVWRTIPCPTLLARAHAQFRRGSFSILKSRADRRRSWMTWPTALSAALSKKDTTMEKSPFPTSTGNGSSGSAMTRGVDSAGEALHSGIDSVADPARNAVDRLSTAAHDTVDK